LYNIKIVLPLIQTREKMITKEKYKKALLIVKDYHEQTKQELNRVELTLEELGLHSTIESTLRDVLVRKESRALEMANDWKLWRKEVFVKDIKAVNVGPIWYYRNVGKKTVQGIKEKLSNLGVEVVDKKANNYSKTQELPVVIFKNPEKYED